MHEIINAVIYLPANIGLDSDWARQCLIHIERRGYRLYSVVSRAVDALALTRPCCPQCGSPLDSTAPGEAQVVVFARMDHMENDFEPRIEIVGDETVDLAQFGIVHPQGDQPGEAVDSRRRRPRNAI